MRAWRYCRDLGLTPSARCWRCLASRPCRPSTRPTGRRLAPLPRLCCLRRPPWPLTVVAKSAPAGLCLRTSLVAYGKTSQLPQAPGPGRQGWRSSMSSHRCRCGLSMTRRCTTVPRRAARTSARGIGRGEWLSWRPWASRGRRRRRHWPCRATAWRRRWGGCWIPPTGTGWLSARRRG